MEREKLFFGFVFFCFIQFQIAANQSNFYQQNLGDFSEADVENSKSIKGACTSNDDCNLGWCIIENGIGVCKCRKGQIGDNCELIAECEENKDMCGNDPKAECTFDFRWKTAYCKCKIRSKRFDVETKTCVDRKPCEKSLKQCKNDGYCAKKREFEKLEGEDLPGRENLTYCQCPLGVSGDFCERVEGCVKKPNYCGDGNKVECRMNSQINRIYCQCLDQEERFDWNQKNCVERKKCRVADECLPFGRCTDKCQSYEPCIDHKNVENKTSCHCVEGTSGHNCEVIDDCKNGVIDCGDDESATCSYYYNEGLTAFTFCKCKNQTLKYDDFEKTCKACDCGLMGSKCSFEKGKQVCECKEGSFNFGDRCQDCKCGSGSTGCSFNGEKKSCFCRPGHFEVNGVCERCDCGMNSTDCKFNEIGKKICTCEPGFKEGSYGVCTPICSDQNKCANGGLCLQDVCVCLAGTGGPYCSTIYECESNMCGEEQGREFGDKLSFENDVNTALCKYDTKSQKAYCDCGHSSYFFDTVKKSCKECTCSEGRCEVRQGQKLCHCHDGYSYNPVSAICERCDCGKFGNCNFDSDGKKICKCAKGFLSYEGSCKECNCGLYGTCRYVTLISKKPSKVCSCDTGYEEYKGVCLKCDCSPNGKCLFSSIKGAHKCVCDPGFQEISGKCILCDCGPDSKGCSFKKNYPPPRKDCKCRRGFKEDEGYCRDIDECLETNICPDTETICENTIGSFKCRCQPGYIPRSVRRANETSLCEKEEKTQFNDKPWKIGYGILSAFFIIVIIGLVVIIFKIRRK